MVVFCARTATDAAPGARMAPREAEARTAAWPPPYGKLARRGADANGAGGHSGSHGEHSASMISMRIGRWDRSSRRVTRDAARRSSQPSGKLLAQLHCPAALGQSRRRRKDRNESRRFHESQTVDSRVEFIANVVGRGRVCRKENTRHDLSERFASKADLTPCFGSAGCVFSNVSGNFLTVVMSARGVGAAARAACHYRAAPTRARVEKHRTTMSPTSAQAERWLAKAGERSGANHPPRPPVPSTRDVPSISATRTSTTSRTRAISATTTAPRLHRPIPCRGHRGSSLARPRHPSRRDAAGVEDPSARLGLREKVAEADTTRFSLATPLPSPR